MSLNLGPTAFVACSGATTSDVLYGDDEGGNWSEGPQTNALSDETEVVTLTVGGNDVKFSTYAQSCFTLGCGAEGEAFDEIVGNINNPEFANNLKQTYQRILEEAPNAEIYVLDYPYITTSGQAWCGVLNVATARPVQELLNYTIWGAVWETNQETQDWRLHYVNTNAEGSPFAGRHLCGSGSQVDFNGLVLPPNKEYSLHPNHLGQLDYASVSKDVIS